jgi:hypothetical protein
MIEWSFTATGTEIVLIDTVLQSVHMRVTDNASNIKKAFKFIDGVFCFLHTDMLCGTVCDETCEDSEVSHRR